jgi:hypothetical protein
MKLTDAQKRALRLIADAKGGAIQKNGTVLCAGQDGAHSDYGSPLHSVTWLRLVGLGLIEGRDGRLVPTHQGYVVAEHIRNNRS